MNDERAAARVRRVLARLAAHLERQAHGDALALDALVSDLLDPELTSDDLVGAAWVLRSLGDVSWSAVPAAADLLAPGLPGPPAERVPSAEERDALTPDAWGYLLGLRRRGSLDAGQFERVLDLLAGSGVRPVTLAMARDAAATVALELDPETSDGIYGDLGVPN